MAAAGPPGAAAAAARSAHALRRDRQRAARVAAAGRLEKAFERIQELEAELRACRGIAGALEDEVEGRLALIAPELAARVLGEPVSGLCRRRRNAAYHCFEPGVSAQGIQSMSGRQLNALQRGDLQPGVGAPRPAAQVDRPATVGQGAVLLGGRPEADLRVERPPPLALRPLGRRQRAQRQPTRRCAASAGRRLTGCRQEQQEVGHRITCQWAVAGRHGSRRPPRRG